MIRLFDISRRGSVPDGRGEPRCVLHVYYAAKAAGVNRRVLVRKGDTRDLWSLMLRQTGILAVGMGVTGLGLWAWRGGAFVLVSTFASFLLLVVLIAIPGSVLTLGLDWRSPRQGRDALLAAGICPACAHGLSGIPPAGDGCVVCPECGAAWSVRSGDHDGG